MANTRTGGAHSKWATMALQPGFKRGDFTVRTLAQTAEAYNRMHPGAGMTRHNAAHIEARALAKLRQALGSVALSEYPAA